MSDPIETAAGDDRPGEWYRKLVEASNDIIVVVDSDGEITYVSPAVNRLLGYDPGDLIGEDVCEHVHPEDCSAFSDVIERLRGTRADTESFEFRCHRADDTWCWFEATVRSGLDDEIDGIILNCRDITERKDREAELRTTKERMKMALEGSKLGIWDWDMETDEVARDELLTEMLGYTPAEMGDHLEDWEQVVHPDGKQRHDEALAEHIEDRTPYYQCEYRLETKSGDWKWVRTMGKVVERAEDGEPVRAVGIHQDIDDRKRAELALKAEREMFEKGPAVVFKWEDARGWPIRYVSENVEDVFGYTPEELRSTDFLYADLVHDADLDRLEQEMAAFNDDGSGFFNPEPYRIRTADGDVRWVMEYTRSHQEDGENAHLLGYLVDITERKRRERELEVREKKYRNLFEDSRDALMLIDRTGYLDCNERALELFGVESVGEFVEYTPWAFSPPTQPDGRDSKGAALERINEAFEAGEAFFEWTHSRVDGTTFPAEVKLSRFEYDGEPVVLGLVRDITERKAYQRQLEEQRDNLNTLNQVLRHDIRNDIQLITSYAELLEFECEDGERQEYIDTILENAKHAVELTTSAQEMADVMRSAEEDLQQIPLRPVLESDIQEVRSTNSDVELTVASTIPEVSVQANNMLSSVFRNLLKNAIQHNDSEVPKVAVSATDRADTVRVRVSDNGPGIPDHQKDAIFGKGEKGLESQGTGIGLYLVKTLVESYGGDIWIEERSSRRQAEPEETSGGATFVVELPKAAQA